MLQTNTGINSNFTLSIDWNQICNNSQSSKMAELHKIICPVNLTHKELSRPFSGKMSDYTFKIRSKVPSQFTLEKLSETSQKLLNEYHSYVDVYGIVYPDFKEVIIRGEFAVDKSKELGYGEQGKVYLAQNIKTGKFVAAKKLFYSCKNGVKETGEYKRLKRLGRARGIYESKEEDFIFLDLVDGIILADIYTLSNQSPQLDCGMVYKLFKKDLNANDRAQLSYNALKEFELVAKEDAIPDEIGSHHTMVQEDLSIRMIDFCPVPYNSEFRSRSLSDFTDTFIWNNIIENWLLAFWADLSLCCDEYKNYNQFKVLENPYVDFVALINGSKKVNPQKALDLLERLMEENHHPGLQKK